jgi:SAM-dependent methyltransferase
VLVAATAYMFTRTVASSLPAGSDRIGSALSASWQGCLIVLIVSVMLRLLGYYDSTDRLRLRSICAALTPRCILPAAMELEKPVTVELSVDRCVVCHQQVGEEATVGGVLRRCLGCGFSRTAEYRPQPDLFDGSVYRDYFGRATQWRYEAGQRLQWLLSVTRPTSLLEAGSAGGYFLQAAQRAGITGFGVEPSEVCVRHARDRLGLNVRHGYLETAAPTVAVQAVCAFHVLEHVEDPREFLVAARTALSADGWLALEVPNISSAGAVRAGGSWANLMPECHRWHFTPESLTRLVEDCGFHVQRCDTAFSRHYVRRHHRLRPANISRLITDWSACGSPKTTHAQLGDFIRLLARASERPPAR